MEEVDYFGGGEGRGFGAGEQVEQKTIQFPVLPY